MKWTKATHQFLLQNIWKPSAKLSLYRLKKLKKNFNDLQKQKFLLKLMKTSELIQYVKGRGEVSL